MALRNVVRQFLIDELAGEGRRVRGYRTLSKGREEVEEEEEEEEEE